MNLRKDHYVFSLLAGDRPIWYDRACRAHEGRPSVLLDWQDCAGFTFGARRADFFTFARVLSQSGTRSRGPRVLGRAREICICCCTLNRGGKESLGERLHVRTRGADRAAARRPSRSPATALASFLTCLPGTSTWLAWSDTGLCRLL